MLIIKEICKAPTFAAQSAEQAYTHDVHRDGKCYPKKEEKKREK